MNALKSRDKKSKREREKSDLISRSVERTASLILKSVALSLHELHGFGEKRAGDVICDAMARVDKYTDRYGSECVEAAMDKILRDVGIEIEVSGR